MLLTRRSFPASLAAAAAAFALPPRPKLFILLVAEQFRTEYFDAHAPSLSPGGFQRLLSRGAYFPNCFSQSVNFTASGLATIATGAYPATHGIVAGRWFDRSAASHAISSAQSGLLEATSFPATFLAADPRNRVFGIGMDSRVTRILTNVTPYSPENTQALAPGTSSKLAWTALGATAPPMRTLDPADPANFTALWLASPLSQAAQFAFARDLISSSNLGRAAGTDLLCIVLGSLGSLGLETGASGPLMFDLVSQLDRQLETLLKFLDDSLGENNYQLAFTAAHGIAGAPAQRIAGQDVAAAAAKSADVEAFIYPFLYLRSGNAEAAVKSIPQAAAWYTASGQCSHTGLIRRRLRNSFYPQRSGDAIIAYAPNVTEDFAHGRGVSYGSIYNYDARVPLVLYGPQFRAAEIEDSVQLTDIAPTLCRALGAGLPSTSSGRVLGQAFQ
jgi:predicted AlkP superfamily pyrophosphatase or phosphodiesterase